MAKTKTNTVIAKQSSKRKLTPDEIAEEKLLKAIEEHGE